MMDEAPYRDRFVIDDPELVYLDGNSLGRLPKQTLDRMQQVIRDQWGSQLIGGWNAHWLAMAQRVGDKIGQVIGASPGCTLICDSTSVNLYKLARALLEHRPDRNVIVTDGANFPSDQYILQGIATDPAFSLPLRTVEVEGMDPGQVMDQLKESLSDRVSLVSLSHMHYKSGMAYDLSRITDLVHSHGASMLWDVSHSVGAMPINIEAVGAEGAVGCTYKYLNGGPGAPAFLYLRKDLHPSLRNPIQGWFGAHKPFEFSTQYEPSPDIERFLVGTPAILSTAAVEPGVDLVLEAGIEWLRERSLRMTEYFISQVDHRLIHCGFDLQTPRLANARGSHVSLGHRYAWQITQALVQEFRVIPDFRKPNTIRFGITPLYTTYSELDLAIDALYEIVQQNRFSLYSAERRGVT